MYNAMDVAQYVINHSIEKGSPVSNLKLQKLLYYIQAAFLVEKDEACFDDNIKNWRHGPVVTNVYDKYKTYLNKSIEDIQNGYSELDMDENYNIVLVESEYNPNKFNSYDKRLMDKVVDSFIKYSPWDIVARTHEEDPWLNTQKNDLITLESIKEFFLRDNNKKRIYGVY